MKALPLEAGEGDVTRIAFAIRIAAVALSITPAAAADLGRFPPAARFYPPPPVLRVYNWTGCYLGPQLGGAFANNHLNGNFNAFVPGTQNADGTGPLAVNLTTPLADNAGSTAVTVGGQGGCDLQVARNWVIGAQVDGVWTHLSGSEGINTTSVGLSEGGHIDQTANALIKADIIATATGRIGYAVNYDDIAGLFYFKGGAAFVNYDTYNITGNNAVTTCADAVFDPKTGCKSLSTANNPFNFNAPSTNRWGWTIGLGTEWVVDGNWSIFGEWDYLNFGNHTVTFTDVNAGSTQLSVKQSINELKLGINYRFGNPLPQQYP
jgi:outer membrane immunogenic protein